MSGPTRPPCAWQRRPAVRLRREAWGGIAFQRATGDHHHLEREKQAAFKKHNGRVQSLVYRPDGDILSGGEDGCVRWWDARTGRDRAAFTWQLGRVNGVAVAPDGLTAAAGTQGGIVVWDLDARSAI
jgi:WD40 repeat protein